MIWQTDYKQLKKMAKTAEVVYKTRKLSYINIPVSFDIETSSFYEGENKRACMYVWAVCVNGLYFTGRTWNDFLKLINDLIKIFKVNENNRLVIYVHNLSYEMQFIKHYFTFKKIIALKKREPINAVTDKGIEFRCSYLLSGYSLSTLADVYLHGKVKKLVGDLDYSLIRLPNGVTPLTRREYQYLYNDVRIVYEYIQMKIEQDGDITKIQNTKTGYVRRVLENNCIGADVQRHMRMAEEQRRYRRLIHRLTIGSVEEYELMTHAYTGGFTHCSCLNRGKTFTALNGKSITSYDFTSSYPTCLIAYPYPVSKGKKVCVTPDNFRKYLKEYCCIFNIKFKGLRASISYEHYLSKHKCVINGKAKFDNGRVIEADELCTSITNVDFDIIEKCYTWDQMFIGDFYTYIKGYLPTPFVRTILDLYEKKTTLKGVAGREAEYQSAKENINSLYGACVTNILHDDFEIVNGEWKSKTPKLEQVIDKYNKRFNRVLFYPWGIFCTAYARYNLFFGGIFQFKEDYVYSDTDSVKVLNADTPEHQKAIRDYNRYITNLLKKACDFHKIPYSKLAPKTIKGVKKPLGVWDYEYTCDFKALRAKCYMVKHDGRYTMTVSGLNKKIATKYLYTKYGNNLFDVFDDKLYIPKGKTGKNTHTYIDEYIEGTVTDYCGNVGQYSECSCVHIEPTDYNLKLTADEFKKIIKGVTYNVET